LNLVSANGETVDSYRSNEQPTTDDRRIFNLLAEEIKESSNPKSTIFEKILELKD